MQIKLLESLAYLGAGDKGSEAVCCWCRSSC